MLVFPVESSNLSRGFSAVEHGMYLGVPPKMVRDASGEEARLTVRIDKLSRAAQGRLEPNTMNTMHPLD